MFYHPAYRWRAVYPTERGSFEVDGVEIDECPVSYVSNEIAELVGSIEIARQVKEATGETPLPPVREWPVRFLDASRLCYVESIREHNARLEAEVRERDDG